MGLFLKHPRSKEPDTMLTAAIAGFTFVTLFTTAALVAAWIMKDPSFLKSVAAIDVAILGPTMASYTARKHTDSKNGKGGFNPRNILKKKGK